MEAILLGVPHVVDRINAGGEQAEADEGKTHPHGDVVVTECARGTGGRDHEQVLDPLAGTERDEGRP